MNAGTTPAGTNKQINQITHMEDITNTTNTGTPATTAGTTKQSEVDALKAQIEALREQLKQAQKSAPSLVDKARKHLQRRGFAVVFDGGELRMITAGNGLPADVAPVPAGEIAVEIDREIKPVQVFNVGGLLLTAGGYVINDCRAFAQFFAVRDATRKKGIKEGTL